MRKEKERKSVRKEGRGWILRLGIREMAQRVISEDTRCSMDDSMTVRSKHKQYKVSGGIDLEVRDRIRRKNGAFGDDQRDEGD